MIMRLPSHAAIRFYGFEVVFAERAISLDGFDFRFAEKAFRLNGFDFRFSIDDPEMCRAWLLAPAFGIRDFIVQCVCPSYGWRGRTATVSICGVP